MSLIRLILLAGGVLAGSASLAAPLEPSALQPFLVWQEFTLATPEDCESLHKELQKFEVPRRLKVEEWSSINCGTIGPTDSITFVQYIESTLKANDKALLEYISGFEDQTFRGSKFRTSKVRQLVAIKKLNIISKEGLEEPWNYATDRVSVYPTYTKAIEDFSQKAQHFREGTPVQFLEFLKDYLGDEKEFRTIHEAYLPEAGLIQIEAQHHLLLEDGRAYRMKLSPFFERSTAVRARMRRTLE